MPDTDFTMGEIARTMQRMDSRLERVLEDHETRLRRVERWMYVLPPTLITAIGAVVLAFVRDGP